MEPMLAVPYTARACENIAAARVMVQPKLDGVRMMAYLDARGTLSLSSRAGNDFGHLLPTFGPGIQKVLAAAGEPIALDGELYCHGASFQTVVSLVKNKTFDPSMRERLSYHTYDAILRGRPTAPFAERARVLEAAVRAAGVPSRIVVVRSVSVECSVASLDAMHDRFAEEGYEGCMIRIPSAPYEPGKRSKSLLKFKKFVDAEFRIVDVVEANGKDSGTAVFVCQIPDSQRTFRVRPEGTTAVRKRYLDTRHALLGKLLTVRYQETSADGIPRFPVGVAVRDYE